MCDICHEQIERGDPVCLSRQVAVLRSSESKDTDKAKAAKEVATWAAMDPQFSSLASACERLKLGKALSSLLGSGASTDAKVQTAALIGAMLQYTPLLEVLDQAGVLSPLLSTLRAPHGSPELKAQLLRAVVALSSTVEGRMALRENSAIDLLLDLLLSARPGSGQEVSQPTCEVLSHLCDDGGDDWRRISQAGAVFSLTTLLATQARSSAPPSPHPTACSPALAPSRRPTRLLPSPPPLSSSYLPAHLPSALTTLATQSVPLQEAVLTLLALLCSHSECRDQVVDAAAMPAIARALGSSSTSVQRCALALSQCLSGSQVRSPRPSPRTSRLRSRAPPPLGGSSACV